MEFHFQSLVAKKLHFHFTEFPFLVPKLKKWAQGFPFWLNGPSRKLEKPTFQNFRFRISNFRSVWKICFRDLSKCDRICSTETLVWCLCTGNKLFLTSTTIICIWFWNSDFPNFEIWKVVTCNFEMLQSDQRVSLFHFPESLKKWRFPFHFTEFPFLMKN